MLSKSICCSYSQTQVEPSHAGFAPLKRAVVYGQQLEIVEIVVRSVDRAFCRSAGYTLEIVFSVCFFMNCATAVHQVTISEFEALLRIETPGLTVRRQAGKLLRQAMKQEQAG